MSLTMRRVIQIVFVLGIVAAYAKPVLAVPTCPPLCLLPPDPAPPMPPINVPDPPFRPIAPTNPDNHNGRGSGATAMQVPHAKVIGKLQEGGECRSGSVEGTVVRKGNQFQCNFAPSTLKAGAACHVKGKFGAVTIVDGKHYCRVAP